MLDFIKRFVFTGSFKKNKFGFSDEIEFEDFYERWCKHHYFKDVQRIAIRTIEWINKEAVLTFSFKEAKIKVGCYSSSLRAFRFDSGLKSIEDVEAVLRRALFEGIMDDITSPSFGGCNDGQLVALQKKAVNRLNRSFAARQFRDRLLSNIFVNLDPKIPTNRFSAVQIPLAIHGLGYQGTEMSEFLSDLRTTLPVALGGRKVTCLANEDAVIPIGEYDIAHLGDNLAKYGPGGTETINDFFTRILNFRLDFLNLPVNAYTGEHTRHVNPQDLRAHRSKMLAVRWDEYEYETIGYRKRRVAKILYDNGNMVFVDYEQFEDFLEEIGLKYGVPFNKYTPKESVCLVAKCLPKT